VNEDDRRIVRDTLIREGTALAVMALVLWYLGPGKLTVSGLLHRARAAAGARAGDVDTQVAQFRAEVSRWDHEQAAQQDRGPAGGGPCGCR
jgi:hypothetical protein